MDPYELRTRRESLGLTQGELASAAGVSRSTIKRMESAGDGPPPRPLTVAKVERVFRVLDTPATEPYTPTASEYTSLLNRAASIFVDCTALTDEDLEPLITVASAYLRDRFPRPPKVSRPEAERRRALAEAANVLLDSVQDLAPDVGPESRLEVGTEPERGPAE